MIGVWIAIFLIVLVQYFSFRHLDIKHDVVKCFLMNEIVSQQNRIELTNREIKLLKLLIARAGQVISRDEIIKQLWTANENPSSRTIDNFILNFRKIFEKNDVKYFHSIRGVGYKFLIP